MRKWGYAIFAIISVFTLINYDIVICKIIKRLPTEVEKVIAERNMSDRYWLHMTNSVEKQRKFWDKYSGMEFDIIYREDCDEFENAHDRTDIILYNNLETQFKEYNIRGG